MRKVLWELVALVAQVAVLVVLEVAWTWSVAGVGMVAFSPKFRNALIESEMAFKKALTAERTLTSFACRFIRNEGALGDILDSYHAALKSTPLRARLMMIREIVGAVIMLSIWERIRTALPVRRSS